MTAIDTPDGTVTTEEFCFRICVAAISGMILLLALHQLFTSLVLNAMLPFGLWTVIGGIALSWFAFTIYGRAKQEIREFWYKARNSDLLLPDRGTNDYLVALGLFAFGIIGVVAYVVYPLTMGGPYTGMHPVVANSEGADWVQVVRSTFWNLSISAAVVMAFCGFLGCFARVKYKAYPPIVCPNCEFPAESGFKYCPKCTYPLENIDFSTGVRKIWSKVP